MTSLVGESFYKDKFIISKRETHTDGGKKKQRIANVNF